MGFLGQGDFPDDPDPVFGQQSVSTTKSGTTVFGRSPVASLERRVDATGLVEELEFLVADQQVHPRAILSRIGAANQALKGGHRWELASYAKQRTRYDSHGDLTRRLEAVTRQLEARLGHRIRTRSLYTGSLHGMNGFGRLQRTWGIEPRLTGAHCMPSGRSGCVVVQQGCCPPSWPWGSAPPQRRPRGHRRPPPPPPPLPPPWNPPPPKPPPPRPPPPLPPPRPRDMIFIPSPLGIPIKPKPPKKMIYIPHGVPPGGMVSMGPGVPGPGSTRPRGPMVSIPAQPRTAVRAPAPVAQAQPTRPQIALNQYVLATGQAPTGVYGARRPTTPQASPSAAALYAAGGASAAAMTAGGSMYGLGNNNSSYEVLMNLPGVQSGPLWPGGEIAPVTVPVSQGTGYPIPTPTPYPIPAIAPANTWKFLEMRKNAAFMSQEGMREAALARNLPQANAMNLALVGERF